MPDTVIRDREMRLILIHSFLLYANVKGQIDVCSKSYRNFLGLDPGKKEKKEIMPGSVALINLYWPGATQQSAVLYPKQAKDLHVKYAAIHQLGVTGN